jgi:hypothetical protein
VAILPDQPPDPTQLVAFVELHVRVALAPLERLVGLAVRVTVGVGALTVTVALEPAEPPAPVQVSEKVVVAARTPVD